MKKFLLATAATIVLATPSIAADMPVKARPAPVVTAYSWTGFYVGIHGGLGRGNHVRDTTAFQNEYDSSGPLFGGHAGFNLQFNRFVIGFEGDGAWADIHGNDGNSGGTLDTTTFTRIFTARGRAGFLLFERMLVFGTGGWAWANVNHFNGAGVPSSNDFNREGWTGGGGVQWAFTDNVSIGTEYRFHDLGRFTNAPAGLAQHTVTNKVHTATLRLSYKFGGGLPFFARY